MTQLIQKLSIMFGPNNKLVIITLILIFCGCKTAKINMTSNYLQYSIIIPPGEETKFYSYERQKRRLSYNRDEGMNLLIDSAVVTICGSCINNSPDITSPDSVKLYLMQNNEFFRYKIIRKKDGFYYNANYYGLEHENKLYWTDTLSHPRFDPQNPLIKPEHTGSFTQFTGRDTIIWTNGLRFDCSIIYEYEVKNSITYPKKRYVYIDKRTGITVMIRRYEPVNGVETSFVMLLTYFNNVR